MQLKVEGGRIEHSELVYGGGLVMVGEAVNIGGHHWWFAERVRTGKA